MKYLILGIQWLVFMLASALVAPIAIADLFGLDTLERAAFVQRTMFVLGGAGLLQVLFGHKFPINEGPAGLWWGVFVIYGGFIGSIYSSSSEVLQLLQGGMIISGFIFLLLSFLGLINKLKNLFTPTVTFVYLFLLILQLSGPFLNGMLGIKGENGTVDLVIVSCSIIIVGFTFYLVHHKVGLIKRYSVLIGMSVGWLLFYFVDKTEKVATSKSLIEFPDIFVWGLPKYDSGIIVTSLFITLLLITNMVASIRIMEDTIKGENDSKRYTRGGFVSGINQLLGGLFSAVGSVPISGAAGFVAATRIVSKIPFLIGAILIIIFSCIPFIMNFLASLPPAVGYSVTFVIFTQMLTMAFTEWSKEENRTLAYRVAGPALLAGMGVMFVSPQATSGLPIAVSAMINNGLIIGTFIAIGVEQFSLRKKV
ncbi:purine permease [Bacillus coahuilensis p1.1.43]|uniref:Purine permease n=1 Tax=Bacillus coahuilensis p1.1.43 TaxID=1150625 RepID=A0A147K8Y1_9BACI|nr:purine/pyrimidine permease [Bacillus coahuilensis]KUP06774.1 purine permease [Bacillus coahuilensis p1.1.43]